MVTANDPVAAPQPQKLSCLAHAGYYVLLFFAYWFGANRFDADGDGDFDPEDVQHFLQDMGIVTRNFKKAPKKTKSSGALPSPTGNRRQPERPASPEAGHGDAGWLDMNGDGQVDFNDVLESAVEGEAVEEYVRNQQRLPIFIMSQSAIALLLWLGGAIHATAEGRAEFMSAKAGLDSFSPGWSDLRLFGPMCQDWRSEAWRNYTYQWTHVGISHILMNCFMNIILGIPLEGLHGFFKMLGMYNAGVIGGAFCYWIADAHKNVVGMSGGCYALIGIHISDLIMNWSQLKFRKPIVFFLVILVTVEVLSYVLALGPSNASHTAHIGGAITGLLAGVLIGKNLVVKRCERVLQGICVFIFLGCAIFCIVWMVTTTPPRNLFESIGYCWIRQVWNPQEFNTNDWVCVTCRTEACTARYTGMQYVETVQPSACTTLLHQ